MPTLKRLTQIPSPVNGVDKLSPPDEVETGYALDMRNWIERDGKLVPRDGIEALTAGQSGLVAFFSFVGVDGNHYLIGVTAGSVFKWDGATQSWVDLYDETETGTYLSSSTFVQAALLETGGKRHLVMVNGVDRPFYYKEGDTCWRWTPKEAPAKASSVCVAAERVIVGVGDEVWASDPMTLDAGWGNYIYRTGQPGEITAVVPIAGNQAAVYQPSSIHLLVPQFDSSVPFRVVSAADGVAGPISKRAVVSHPSGGHLFLGGNGELYFFDGGNVSPANAQVGACLRADATTTVSELVNSAWLFYDGQRDELYIFYGKDLSSTIKYSKALVVKISNGAVFPLTFGGGVCGVGPLLDESSSPGFVDMGDITFSSISTTFGDLTQSVWRVGVLVVPSGQSDAVVGVMSRVDQDVGYPITLTMIIGVMPPDLQNRYSLTEIGWFLSGAADDSIEVTEIVFCNDVEVTGVSVTANIGKVKTRHLLYGKRYKIALQVDNAPTGLQLDGIGVTFVPRGRW